MYVYDNGDQQTELWLQALTIISEKLSKPAFETWFSQTSAYGDEHRLTIVSDETMKSEWLEVRYIKLIRETVSQLTGNTDVEFRFESKEQRKNPLRH